MLIWLLHACISGPVSEGWAPSYATGGPTVRYDPLAQPLPEIPLPNDAATRLDVSPTGRRVNVSLDAARTDHEREVRGRFNRMDGFSTLLPVTVSFDAPLDVLDLRDRHDDSDFRDDAVFVLNVDPDCARFGEEVALDIGRGIYPVTSYKHAGRDADPLAPDGYRVDHGGNTLFPYDAHGEDNQRLFQETNEDLDGDGALDPGEDVDQDGVLDVANLDDPRACDGEVPGSVAYDRCVADHLLTWYERESNTLILRPLWPLEQRCTYAVVLTDRLRGVDGKPVQSPFPAVNHRDQTRDLERATSLLSRYDLAVGDVAFAWTFTTGSMTADLEALRAGLYGHGVYSHLAEKYPVSSLRLWTRQEMAEAWGVEPGGPPDDTWVPGACLGSALTRLWSDGLGEWGANMCAVEADLSAVSMFFGGTFQAPDLLADQDGVATPRYPQTQDEVWSLDPSTGALHEAPTEVTFWCALPYEDPDVTCAPGNPDGVPFCKPFPTILYGHGYGGARAEISLHMGRHAAMGYAGCSLDAYGHGANVYRQDPQVGTAFLLQMGRFREAGVPELAGLMTTGRDRDLNNDGIADPGMDQWTYDIFHTRDMVRQSALEVTQLVRILRHMDGATVAADGRLLGDVDGDGTVDWGGPANTLAHWGISLGGIISGVVTGSEPSLDATSPNAGGAGLTDISARSSQAGVPEAVILPMMGPLLVGCLPTDGHDNPLPVGAPGGTDCHFGDGAEDATWQGGTLRLAFYAQDRARRTTVEFASVEGVQPGDRVCLRNLDGGHERCGLINARGWIRLGVAADAVDAVARRPILGLEDDDTEPFALDDPLAFGDPLEVEVYAGPSDVSRARVDTWQREVTFQGSRYLVGTPLVALYAGYGYERQTPDFRRLLGFAQAAIGPGDPGVWGPHAFVEPLDVSYDPFTTGGNTHVLMMPTAGDSNVPVNTGIHQGRTAGLFGSWLRDEATYGPEVGWRQYFVPRPNLGMTVDEWLVAHHVIEGDPRFQRFADNPLNPNVIFDPDNVSDGAAMFSCGPSDWSAIIGENECPPELEGQEVFFPIPQPAPGAELRLDWPRADGTWDAFRIPVLRPAGQHGIYNAQPFRPFDADGYMVNFTVRFLGTGGADVSHEAGCDCSATAPGRFQVDGEDDFPGRGRQCVEEDLNVCDATCAAGWGLRTPALAACSP